MASPQTQRSVIVTGGASGIGLAMTRYYASQGYNVSVLDINEKTGPGIKCDVSSWEDQAATFKEIFEECGRIDVVMANAGISEQGQSCIMQVEEDAPAKPTTNHKIGPPLHAQERQDIAIPGSIIVTASNAGVYPFPIAPLYAAAKAGLINLVRSMGPALEKANIQINALAPAVLETNIAPSNDLFKHMIITPMSTLIHGDSVTVREPHDYVDEDSKKNLEMFRSLGYA
ncbi:unnamed protein product [Parascedosporium putredinis]|uniref:Uncharacterized protein n=1 Tax=Parascedosporium putredinis TaxID=1442378 RepID=A0A9P1MC69_9PEZI|nr:unnamed protein product [Parascedosporium putredinis]CAI7997311.1 unnamed protein product [Parascedosporium putredinis]